MELTQAPTLETGRLRMRMFREGDLDDYAALNADPEVTQFIGGPWDRGRSWRHLAFLLGHWKLRGLGAWALEHKETGVFMGSIGTFGPALIAQTPPGRHHEGRTEVVDRDRMGRGQRLQAGAGTGARRIVVVVADPAFEQVAGLGQQAEQRREVRLRYRGRSAGGFDDGRALADPPVAQPVQEQRARQPVLEAAGGVGRFVFEVELHSPRGWQRVAD